MDNSAQRRGMVSPSGAGLFFVRFLCCVAAMVAAAAVSLLPALGAPQTVLPAPDRVALVVMVMSLAFAGVLLSTLLNLPDTTRRSWFCLQQRFSVQDSLHWWVGLPSVERVVAACESKQERKNQMKVFRKRAGWCGFAVHTGLLAVASLVFSLPTFAASGGQALPWEAPLTRLQQSLSGPVAGAIAVIALVAIGVVLVFGGEWNEFARRSVYAVCAIAFIVSAGTLLAGLFQVGAAIV